MLLKLLRILIIPLALSLGIFYVFDKYSETLTIEISEFRIETSLAVACIATLVISAISWSLLNCVLCILKIPLNIKKYLHKRNTSLKEQNLENTIIAIGNQELKLLNRCEKNLGSESFETLLKFQISNIKKDAINSKKYVLQMLENQETYVAGLIKLVEISNLENNWSDVAKYGKELIKHRPSSDFISLIVKSYMSRGLWEDLSNFIDAKIPKSVLNNPTANDILAICNYKIIKKIFFEKKEISESSLKDLQPFSKKFVPSLILLINIHINLKQYKEAASVISKSWKGMEPILIKYALKLIRFSPKTLLMKISDNIASKSIDKEESKLIIAYANLLSDNIENIKEEHPINNSSNFFENLFSLEYGIRKRGNLNFIDKQINKVFDIENIPIHHYYWNFLDMKISSHKISSNCIEIASV